jgi:hypothetical protein
MRLKEGFIKSVTFLYVDTRDEETGQVKRTAGGTAFFVGVPLAAPNSSVVYLVTARHNIARSRKQGMLYVRIRQMDGEPLDIPVPQDEWIQHLTTDVAVIAMRALPTNHDHKVIGLEHLATWDFFDQWDVGPGDEFFYASLFTEFGAEGRVSPIARFGTLSLVVRDPEVEVEIEENSKHYIPAILAETRSFGGVSGSPVFLYFSVERYPGEVNIYGKDCPRVALMGLIQGHFHEKAKVKFPGDPEATGRVPINYGIAIIVPAQAVWEVLMYEELQEQREEIDRIIDCEPDVTSDSTFSDKLSDEEN